MSDNSVSSIDSLSEESVDIANQNDEDEVQNFAFDSNDVRGSLLVKNNTFIQKNINQVLKTGHVVA